MHPVAAGLKFITGIDLNQRLCPEAGQSPTFFTGRRVRYLSRHARL